MPRVLLITNPAAARHDPDVVGAVSSALGAEGWEVDVAGTTKGGDAGRLAAQGVADGVNVIAVYGGDGTTMQAVGGMVGAGIPLALIPGGTGNLLAGNLRLPRDPVEAARLVAGGKPRRVDVGQVERPDGVRYFAVNCGAGIDAQIMEGTTAAAKRRWGMAAYVAEAWDVLTGVRSVPYRVTVDAQTLDVEAVTVLVANCGEVGPLYFSLGHGIALDDGWLDVVVLRAEGITGSLATIWELFRQPANGSGRVLRARGKSITVECQLDRPVQMDGELAGRTPFSTKVVAGAIEVLVPSRL